MSESGPLTREMLERSFARVYDAGRQASRLIVSPKVFAEYDWWSRAHMGKGWPRYFTLFPRVQRAEFTYRRAHFRIESWVRSVRLRRRYGKGWN